MCLQNSEVSLEMFFVFVCCLFVSKLRGWRFACTYYSFVRNYWTLTNWLFHDTHIARRHLLLKHLLDVIILDLNMLVETDGNLYFLVWAVCKFRTFVSLSLQDLHLRQVKHLADQEIARSFYNRLLLINYSYSFLHFLST